MDLANNFNEHMNVMSEFYRIHNNTVIRIAQIIIDCYKKGGKVLIYGNGGSYSDALHFAGELEGAYKNRTRIPLPVITLSNPATLTAVANDFGFETIFARNVKANANEGDIVIGFSTSGGSNNIIEAFKEAKSKKAITIAFTGQDGMKEPQLVDILLNVPSTNTPRIQEAHEWAYHEICGIVEKELFG